MEELKIDNSELFLFGEDISEEDSYQLLSFQVNQFLERVETYRQELEREKRKQYKEKGEPFDPQAVYVEAQKEALESVSIRIEELSQALAQDLLISFEKAFNYDFQKQKPSFKMSGIETFAKKLDLYSKLIVAISLDPGLIRGRMKDDFLPILAQMPVFSKITSEERNKIQDILKKQLQIRNEVLNDNKFDEICKRLTSLCDDIKLEEGNIKVISNVEEFRKKIDNLSTLNIDEDKIYRKLKNINNQDDLSEIEKFVKKSHELKSASRFKLKNEILKNQIITEFDSIYKKYKGNRQRDLEVDHIFYGIHETKFDPKNGEFGTTLSRFFYALSLAFEENDQFFLEPSEKVCQNFLKKTQKRIDKLTSKKTMSFFEKVTVTSYDEKIQRLSDRYMLVERWQNYLLDENSNISVTQKKKHLEDQVKTEGEKLVKDDWLTFWGKVPYEIRCVLKIKTSTSTPEEEFKEVLDSFQ